MTDGPEGRRPLGWLETEIDGHTVRTWILIGLAIAAVVLAFGVWWTYGRP